MVIAKAGHTVLRCCRATREAAAFVSMPATHASGFGRSGATLHRACSACVALVVLATHAPGFDRSGASLHRACSVFLVLVAHLLGHWLHYEGCAGERTGGGCVSLFYSCEEETRLGSTPRAPGDSGSPETECPLWTVEGYEVELGSDLVLVSRCAFALATMCLGLWSSRRVHHCQCPGVPGRGHIGHAYMQ